MALYKKGQGASTLKRTKLQLGNDTYICVRELSSKELLNLQAHQGEQDHSESAPNMDFVFSIIATCACDDEGKPIFDSKEDVKQNLDIGVSSLVEIQRQIMTLSGLDSPKN